ncbi:hypothetical protein [Asticcacaulis solisilvae]|uniref:hypothetical protein n=1 Tax=Asticcacaulis solisilvae TaxID=1217274 RepID=UPI003FD6EA56
MQSIVIAAMLAAAVSPWTYSDGTAPQGASAVQTSAPKEGQAPLTLRISGGESRTVALVSATPLTFCHPQCFARIRWSADSVTLVALDETAGGDGATAYVAAPVMTQPILDGFRKSGAIQVDFMGDTTRQVYRFSYAGLDLDRVK